LWFDEYSRAFLHTFFRVQDGPRCQYIRETPHLGNAQTMAACDYPLDPSACAKVGKGASCSVKRRLRVLEEPSDSLASCRQAHCVSARTREVEQVSSAQKTPKDDDWNQTGPGRPCDVCCVVDLESHLVRQKRSGEAAGPSCPELAVAECEVMVLEARPPQQVDLATGA
jgi:hypothetical protein